ncbi:MAG: penicillin-binding transpeptidase domain-containing protein [Candidatus Babeliales bacterium]|jgi:penicillin-binding protein 2
MLKNRVLATRASKIRYILYGFCGGACILAFRLFSLQINNGGALHELGTKNFLRIEIIPPLRGDVYDTHHELLAANRPVFDVFWYGSGKQSLSPEEQEIARKIGPVLGIDFSQDHWPISLASATRYARRLLLKSDISFQQLCQISELCADARCLVISNRFQRMYPHNETACHVLGYLNRGERSGQSGIELKLDALLQGAEGRVLRVINSTGKLLAQQVYKEAKAGADITLTIDFKLQKLAETLFEEDNSGAFILMDPADGAIRALVSCPRFDPNVFLAPLNEATWDKLTANNPLLNRAACGLYPPASTFKLVTWAAGLEEGVADQNSEVCCNGYVDFCGRKYFCMRHTGHGVLSPQQALEVSCNVPCFRMACKLTVDCIAQYAHRFGLGRKTGFLLPEREGLVPTTQWKKRVKGERWWRGETLSVSIGQGYLMATPLQVARMVGAICTGYLITPRLLENEVAIKEPLDISPKTLTFLRNAMKEVVHSGTGQRLGRISSFEVFAKTGTAQTCSLEREKAHKYLLEHGWLVGYFLYQGQKPLVMLVLLENIGSSHFAVHLAEKFLRGYRSLMHELEHPVVQEIVHTTEECSSHDEVMAQAAKVVATVEHAQVETHPATQEVEPLQAPAAAVDPHEGADVASHDEQPDDGVIENGEKNEHLNEA